MKVRVFILLGMFGMMGPLLAENITCDDRKNHGISGFKKGVAAVIGCAALYHMIGEVWDTSKPLRTGRTSAQLRNQEDSLLHTLFAAIGMGSVAYLTYTLGSSSVDSLRVFLKDDEEVAEKEDTSKSEGSEVSG